METDTNVNAYTFEQQKHLENLGGEIADTNSFALPKVDFLSSLKNVSAAKLTENGALALSTSFSALLDLFAQIGALRTRTNDDIINIFLKAYAEDKDLALKTLFYARDIRGPQGLGERRTFRVILSYLADYHSDDIKHLIPLIPFYGRWDDVLCLCGTPLEETALDLIAKQFESDLQNLNSNHLQNISLLAKWLPSVNASSKATCEMAKYLLKHGLHISQKEYRHKLSALRTALRVIEKYISTNAWDQIDYAQVPSYAAVRYAQAFYRHDEERYGKFLDSVMRGEAKIHADTLYPYDIVRTLFTSGWADTKFTTNETAIQTAQQLWNSLPNYLAEFGAENQRYLVMADTSGSMFDNIGSIYRSVSLAIYFAERTSGHFGDTFLTFTTHPTLVDLPANLSLIDKLRIVLDPNNVGYSTNLDAAFEQVLKAAVSHNLPQSELPTSILVISDMEIDEAIHDWRSCGFDDDDEEEQKRAEYIDPTTQTFTARWTQKFAEFGYVLPNIVYWNVNARNNTFHATQTDNVRFVSGSSAATFTTLCKTGGMTATETMLATLLDERYAQIHT